MDKQLAVAKSSKTAGNALATELKQSLTSVLFLLLKLYRQFPTKALARLYCICRCIKQIPSVLGVFKVMEVCVQQAFLQLGAMALMQSKINAGMAFPILQPGGDPSALGAGSSVAWVGSVILKNLYLGTRVDFTSRRP